MEKIKVLVVDDSLFIRRVLTDILNADPHIEVVEQAVDGLDALQILSKTKVDVVTLDLDMPKLDGLATLKKIMEMKHPPAVVVVSSYTQNGAAITIECLQSGAVDFVLKLVGSETGELQALAPEIIKKVKIASAVNREKLKPLYTQKTVDFVPKKENKMGAVVIGSSTGGTVALEHLLPGLPNNFPYPVLIAQHLPAKFVESLVVILRESCLLPIKMGEEKEIVQPGVVYFAPGGCDMQVIRDERDKICLTLIEDDAILTPSVDKLMTSATKVYGENTIGIILTGMGNDGLDGMRTIKEAHGKTLVQDEKTSVVFGMGREVIEAGLADHVLPLDKIAQKVVEKYL